MIKRHQRMLLHGRRRSGDEQCCLNGDGQFARQAMVAIYLVNFLCKCASLLKLCARGGDLNDS